MKASVYPTMICTHWLFDFALSMTMYGESLRHLGLNHLLSLNLEIDGWVGTKTCDVRPSVRSVAIGTQQNTSSGFSHVNVQFAGFPSFGQHTPNNSFGICDRCEFHQMAISTVENGRFVMRV